MEISPAIIKKLSERSSVLAENSAAINSAISASFPISLRDYLTRRVQQIVDEGSSLKSKIRQLQLLTSEARAPSVPHVPCHRGCSACCHMQIELTQTEAAIIGQSVDRQPIHLPVGRHTTSGRVAGLSSNKR